MRDGDQTDHPLFGCKERTGGEGVNFLDVQDVSDPVRLADYYSRSGADELVFYDITASVEGRAVHRYSDGCGLHHLHSPDRGGGISRLEDFEAGAVLRGGQGLGQFRGHPDSGPDRPGGQALRRPVRGAVCGRQAGGWTVPCVPGGGRVDTGLDALEWIHQGVDRGLARWWSSSIDTDGVKGRLDLELLQEVSRLVRVPSSPQGAQAGSGICGSLPVCARRLRRTGGQHLPLRDGGHPGSEAGVGQEKGVGAVMMDLDTLKFGDRGLIPAIVQETQRRGRCSLWPI